MKYRSRTSRARRGTDVIEFALVLPVLLLLMGAIADYGWYFHREVVLASLVADATRAAATAPANPDETPEQLASQEVTRRLEQAGYTGSTALDIQVLGTTSDKLLTVAVRVTQTPLFYIAPDVVSARYAMRLEDQPQ